MKKEWKIAEIAELNVQATAKADLPVTGVDDQWMGEDGRLRFKPGVAYASGSASQLTLTGEAAEHAQQ